MTSVLYGSGLNYQGSNPIRNEIRQVQNSISDIRKLIEGVDARVSRAEASILRLTERSNQVVEALNSLRNGSGATPLPAVNNVTAPAPVPAPAPAPVPAPAPAYVPPPAPAPVPELVALA